MTFNRYTNKAVQKMLSKIKASILIGEITSTTNMSFTAKPSKQKRTFHQAKRALGREALPPSSLSIDLIVEFLKD